MSADTRFPSLQADGKGEGKVVKEAGDLIVSYIEQLGVEFVFGIPGGAIEPLYNALLRSARRGGPRPVLARHETGAAFMADGYARETGRLGVCCSTTGPGATNLITGVSCARENEVPLLVITAQTALPTLGRNAFQESSCTAIDTVGMYDHCTRFNSLVSHPTQLERKLTAAILTAFRPPKGPVHLSIPLDVLRSPSPVQQASVDLSKLLRPRCLIDEAAISAFYSEIAESRKVALVIGPGCDGAVGLVLELALLLEAPVVATPDGKGLVSPYHPQFRGIFGFAGHSSAKEALNDPTVDRIIAIGTRFGELASGGWDTVLLGPRLVHVDSAQEHFSQSPMARLQVAGDPTEIFERIVARLYRERFPGSERLGPERRQNQRKETAESIATGDRSHLKRRLDPARTLTLDDEAKYRDEDSEPIKPQRLMYELSRIFPVTTRFLVDAGNCTSWGIHYLHPFDRRVAGPRPASGGLFRTCMDFSPMGWAIGSAVGTAIGRPGIPVVCIVGDGSWLMNGQEITVAVSERLPVIFVVLNDGALGMIKHGQRLAGAEQGAYELPPVNFCSMARAMGAAAFTICNPRHLADLDTEAICARQGPTLLDVHVDPEEVPPIAVRMKVLGMVG